MTRCIILIVLAASFLAGARPAAAQQHNESDFLFVSQLIDFGPATKSAVKAFQKKKSLDADGIVGPDTWMALRAARTVSDAMVFDLAVDLITRAGEEIHVDEFGRVKVRIPWDQSASQLLKQGSKGQEVGSLQSGLNR
ncbi:MAG: peptidoglycan-binding protein [Pirellulaceae bacterium]